MTYIPSAVSKREAKVLQRYAKGKQVVEVGALLGYSTVALASAPAFVVSIDRHSGYTNIPNDTYRQFRRNLWVTGVSSRVSPVVGDFLCMTNYRADFTFIDLDGTYETTLSALTLAPSAIVGVHDFERSNCAGVSMAVEASGYDVLERADSLLILRRPRARHADTTCMHHRSQSI